MINEIQIQILKVLIQGTSFRANREIIEQKGYYTDWIVDHVQSVSKKTCKANIKDLIKKGLVTCEQLYKFDDDECHVVGVAGRGYVITKNGVIELYKSGWEEK